MAAVEGRRDLVGLIEVLKKRVCTHFLGMSAFSLNLEERYVLF